MSRLLNIGLFILVSFLGTEKLAASDDPMNSQAPEKGVSPYKSLCYELNRRIRTGLYEADPTEEQKEGIAKELHLTKQQVNNAFHNYRKRNNKTNKRPTQAQYDILYTWLEQNLSNPYPSPEIINQLAEETGRTRDFIRVWFRNARERHLIYLNKENEAPNGTTNSNGNAKKRKAIGIHRCEKKTPQEKKQKSQKTARSKNNCNNQELVFIDETPKYLPQSHPIHFDEYPANVNFEFFDESAMKNAIQSGHYIFIDETPSEILSNPFEIVVMPNHYYFGNDFVPLNTGLAENFTYLDMKSNLIYPNSITVNENQELYEDPFHPMLFGTLDL